MADLIFHRNALSIFHAGFFSDAARTIPVSPINADYPKYSIYDTAGVEILNGVGSVGIGAGYWQVQLVIDEQYHLTKPDERYKIIWTMVNANNQQFNFEQEFELFEPALSEPEDREQKYISMAGTDVRLRISLQAIPDSISVAVFQNMDQQSPIFVANSSQLMRASTANSNEHVFYIDLPGGLTNINYKYSIVWKVRRTPTDTESFTYQVLTTVGAYTLNLITSVRMLIDKFQKRLGTVQAYEDSDIVEYLERGMELLNSSFPLTNFQIGATPGALNVFHIMLSSWYALNAQQLLETDLGFSFSGQAITLDYDHASQLSDVMGRWKDYIDANLTQAKTQILNQQGSVGTSAGRGMRYTQTMTWKVASYGTTGQMSPNSLMGQMNTLGLLW